MLKGDISNELPKRVIVVIDTFLDVEVSVKKQFKVIPVTKRTETFNRSILSRLYVFSQRVGYTLELDSFNSTEEPLEVVTEKLDKMGTNPFRYFTAYTAIDHLVNELPYRPEVIGVLDLPTRLLRYGHWGMDFSQL
jgi:hypothetical protein